MNYGHFTRKFSTSLGADLQSILKKLCLGPLHLSHASHDLWGANQTRWYWIFSLLSYIFLRPKIQFSGRFLIMSQLLAVNIQLEKKGIKPTRGFHVLEDAYKKIGSGPRGEAPLENKLYLQYHAPDSLFSYPSIHLLFQCFTKVYFSGLNSGWPYI